MKLKKYIINIPKISEENSKINYKNFEICEKCRINYLGKYNNNGESITWKKISYGNCYC